jgi:hypothetical protein
MNTKRKFSEVINFIEQERKVMFETNPFFKTIVDTRLTAHQRMLFIPYMLFFSCGGPDVITLLMRSKKAESNLTILEKKINAFINEDNFHYNFYLNDLEKLGYTMEKFGSVNAVIRHVFSEESISVRRLVYNLGYYSRQHADPLIRLTLCELIEAGLFDLFVTIYKKIVKEDNSPFANLEYFGDTHVNLEMNHTVTSWFSGNQSEISDLEIADSSLFFMMQIVKEIMADFNEMYLAFNQIILNGDTIFPEKYVITNLPPIDEITNKKYSSSVTVKKMILEEHISAMKQHKVFKMIDSIEKLGTFMQWHVFAVWDFMSLLKRLQKELTGSSLPWIPPKDSEMARLINEIVLGEETDVLPDGSPISHFDLYLNAMKEVKASTHWIDHFILELKTGKEMSQTLANLPIPNAIKEFVIATLTTASQRDVFEVLGSFFYGREDVIPGMFQNLLNSWSIKSENAPMFVYYLQRHIELDSDEHGPALQKIIDKITKNEPEKLTRILDSAILAVQNRVKLWDALLAELNTDKITFLESSS